MLSTIEVEYYGAPAPLQNLASVSAPDAATLMIKPFDKSGLKVSSITPSSALCIYTYKLSGSQGLDWP